MASKVSFTVRRPTPVSRDTSDSEGPSFKVPALPRHLANDSVPGSPLASTPTNYDSDSSNDNDEEQDELVSGFDRFGVQRANRPKREKPTGPLIIPALQNRDWREIARKRKSAGQYIPASSKAQTGADGSVGGLGTRDSINSGPVLSGLQFKKRDLSAEVKTEDEPEDEPPAPDVKMEPAQLSEDEAALRAVLAEANGDASDLNGPVVDIIPAAISEADALKQDVVELPESASLDDYARVPVSQFGAALLRGIGWKEGQAASRKPGKGLVEPYLPQARPALLGIGAKEQEVYDDGSKNKKNRRPEKRYVPVIKQDRGKESSSRERSPTRKHRSRSPRRDRDRESHSTRSSPGRRRDYDYDYDDRKRDLYRRDREYGSDYERSDRDKPRDRERERDKERDRGRYRDDRHGDERKRSKRDY